jgi:hypothetical protein
MRITRNIPIWLLLAAQAGAALAGWDITPQGFRAFCQDGSLTLTAGSGGSSRPRLSLVAGSVQFHLCRVPDGFEVRGSLEGYDVKDLPLALDDPDRAEQQFAEALLDLDRHLAQDPAAGEILEALVGQVRKAVEACNAPPAAGKSPGERHREAAVASLLQGCPRSLGMGSLRELDQFFALYPTLGPKEQKARRTDGLPTSRPGAGHQGGTMAGPKPGVESKAAAASSHPAPATPADHRKAAPASGFHAFQTSALPVGLQRSPAVRRASAPAPAMGVPAGNTVAQSSGSLPGFATPARRTSVPAPVAHGEPRYVPDFATFVALCLEGKAAGPGWTDPTTPPKSPSQFYYNSGHPMFPVSPLTPPETRRTPERASRFPGSHWRIGDAPVSPAGFDKLMPRDPAAEPGPAAASPSAEGAETM